MSAGLTVLKNVEVSRFVLQSTYRRQTHSSRRAFSLPPQASVRWRIGKLTGDRAERMRKHLHVEQTPLGVIEWNPTFEVTAWNPAAERIFGYTAAEAIGKHAFDLLVPPHITPHIVEAVWKKLLARRGGGERSINENVTKSGTVVWCDWYNTPLIDGRGSVVGVASLVLDVTHQREAEREREAALLALKQSEERFRLMTERASDLVSIVDEKGTISYLSEAVRHLLGYAPAELVGTTVSHLVHEDDLPLLQAALGMGRIAPNAASEPVAYRFRHKNGDWRWIESIAANLLSHPGVGGLLINSRDITERVQASEKFKWQAQHDSLTGLPNRALFMTQAESVLKAARRRKQKTALLFIDLDRFKWVNDTMGHDAGDAVLQEVARRLQSILPVRGLLARLSGDEFALLLSGLVRIRDAAQTARRVLHVLSHPPIRSGEREIIVGASVGVAVSPRDGLSTEILLKAADAAMYRAKEHAAKTHTVPLKETVRAKTLPVGAGMVGSYQFFTPEMDAAAMEQQAFEAALRRAIRGGPFHASVESRSAGPPQTSLTGGTDGGSRSAGTDGGGGGELCLVFQPIIDRFAEPKWQGVEALLRWRHPELGIIGPDRFLETVRENGLTEPLNRWVLREACRTAAQWQSIGLVLPVWVNIAVAQSLDTAAAVLVSQVESALSEWNVRPEMLVLEVTPAMVADVLATGTLRALKNCGVGLALDDFGTGHSSLAALRHFPLTALKIDRALVQNMVYSSEEAALVRAVVDMAHALHFQVVAEGVESDVQQNLLREMHCDLMQGYHIRRPLSAQDVAREFVSFSSASDALVSLSSLMPAPPGPTGRSFPPTGYNKKNAARLLETGAAERKG